MVLLFLQPVCVQLLVWPEKIINSLANIFINNIISSFLPAGVGLLYTLLGLADFNAIKINVLSLNCISLPLRMGFAVVFCL